MTDMPGLLEIHVSGMVIVVRVQWLPGPRGRGAIRARDRATWDWALWCDACHTLGYDPADIDAVLEAQRLGVDHAPRVAACETCEALRCDRCRCCR